jgi:hypothetical protein
MNTLLIQKPSKAQTDLVSLLTLLIALFVSSVVSGQTTEEEFNYLTKGYKIQIESGLDMKGGYSIKEYGTWGTTYSSFNRNATFKGLYREGEDSPCAVLVIFDKTNSSYREYVCIPHMESTTTIWKKAHERWQDAGSDWGAGAGYSWGVAKFISYQFSE